jgi:hypothetical protein
MKKEKLVIVFTGTRKGMSDYQKHNLVQELNQWKPYYNFEWHHGCCTGADAEFDNIIRKYNKYGHLHPSNDPKTRIDCYQEGDYNYQQKPPLVRDREMVQFLKQQTILPAFASLLIAAPRSDNRIIRSGTWTTVRYAEHLANAKINKICILKR